jgi:OPA family glycerol-3-phosphate transporter-like MFS transporter
MSNAKLRSWQRVTLTTLLVGYTGYYFCRSNLSAVGPALIAEGGDVDKASLGAVVSAGVAVYAVGKLVLGTLCDFTGGRWLFVAGMVLSAALCALIGLFHGLGALLVLWSLNRFVQSAGWGALVKVASRWFEPERFGTVMGVLSLSYLFGDAVAKLSLGELVQQGFGPGAIFLVSAGVLAGLSVPVWWLLRESPADRGLPEPRARPANVFGDAGNHHRPPGLAALLATLLRSPSFLLVCALSFGLTVIRETLNFWTPVFLVEAAGAESATATKLSSLFPLFGGFSILLAGWLSDKLTQGRRGRVMMAFLAASTFGLVLLATLPLDGELTLCAGLISFVGLGLLGPYAFLSGAMALDLGGKSGSAAAAGIADAVGYLGSVASGYGVGALAQEFGWGAAFGALAGLAVLTLAAAVAYAVVHERKPQATAEER